MTNLLRLVASLHVCCYVHQDQDSARHKRFVLLVVLMILAGSVGIVDSVNFNGIMWYCSGPRSDKGNPMFTIELSRKKRENQATSSKDAKTNTQSVSWRISVGKA